MVKIPRVKVFRRRRRPERGEDPTKQQQEIIIEFDCNNCDDDKLLCGLCNENDNQIIENFSHMVTQFPRRVYLRKDITESILVTLYIIKDNIPKIPFFTKFNTPREKINELYGVLEEYISDYGRIEDKDDKVRIVKTNKKYKFIKGPQKGMVEFVQTDKITKVSEYSRDYTQVLYFNKPLDLMTIIKIVSHIWEFRTSNSSLISSLKAIGSIFTYIHIFTIARCDNKGSDYDCFL